MSLQNTATVMTQVCDDLEAMRKRVASAVAFNGGDSRKEAWLTQVADYIRRLRPDGVEGKRVLSGDPTYPFSRWETNVRDVRNMLAHELGDISSWGMEGLLGAVRQTAVDIKAKATSVAGAVEANFYPVLILVVIALIALAVIRVA